MSTLLQLDPMLPLMILAPFLPGAPADLPFQPLAGTSTNVALTTGEIDTVENYV